MGRILEALHNLRTDSLTALQYQQNVISQFPAIIMQSHLYLVDLATPISYVDNRFIIGVATWSSYDWKLLDAVDTALEHSSIRVDVFDVDQYPLQEAFEKFIPGIGKVYHTPVVGLWRDGKLTQAASGAAGRGLVLNWFNIALNSQTQP